MKPQQMRKISPPRIPVAAVTVRHQTPTGRVDMELPVEREPTVINPIAGKPDLHYFPFLARALIRFFVAGLANRSRLFAARTWAASFIGNDLFGPAKSLAGSFFLWAAVRRAIHPLLVHDCYKV
jgi:hypothetical protein